MEKLAALEHRIDTATEKLAIKIKIELMDVSGEIERIKLHLQEIESKKEKGGAN
ncbi:hypothetical protein [Microcoleus sp. MON2_D5]|uniref:hypothetical protein n=1 Tax=Microcoleus sp. MON2_D5 TaxID=2818833 RepID=UPI002FCF3F88